MVRLIGTAKASGEVGTDDAVDGEDTAEDGSDLGGRAAAVSDPEEWGGDEMGVDGMTDDVAVLQRSSKSPSRTISRWATFTRCDSALQKRILPVSLSHSLTETSSIVLLVVLSTPPLDAGSVLLLATNEGVAGADPARGSGPESPPMSRTTAVSNGASVVSVRVLELYPERFLSYGRITRSAGSIA